MVTKMSAANKLSIQGLVGPPGPEGLKGDRGTMASGCFYWCQVGDLNSWLLGDGRVK